MIITIHIDTESSVELGGGRHRSNAEVQALLEKLAKEFNDYSELFEPGKMEDLYDVADNWCGYIRISE